MLPLASSLAEGAGGMPEEVAAAIGKLDAELERTRYPSGNASEPIPADAVDKNDAEIALDCAEAVMAWAQSLLQLPSGKPGRPKS